MREETGGLYCHVLNGGNGRAEVFHDDADYAGFVELLSAACDRVAMRVAAVCLLPNHFHLVVRPRADGDLGRWMQWLMTSHVRRYHRRYGTSGHVWQGRYKSFVTQKRRPSAAQRASGVVEVADPLWTVVRYVERNPLRAGLVDRAEDWPWSSLAWWVARERAKGGLAPSAVPVPLSPVAFPPAVDETSAGSGRAKRRQAVGAAAAEPATPNAPAEPATPNGADERGTGTEDGASPRFAGALSPPPIPFDLDRPDGWLDTVNQPQTDDELAALRRCISRGRPFGSDRWVHRIARTLGLEPTLRPRGRPRKDAEK